VKDRLIIPGSSLAKILQSLVKINSMLSKFWTFELKRRRKI